MDDVMQLVESLPQPASMLKEKKWLADLRTRTVQVMTDWLLSLKKKLLFLRVQCFFLMP